MRASIYSMDRQSVCSGENSDLRKVTSYLQVFSSHPEQRDVLWTQVAYDGRVHAVLSLEVKEQPGHCVDGDVGHHSKGISVQGVI